jgi:hypothetical protein
MAGADASSVSDPACHYIYTPHAFPPAARLHHTSQPASHLSSELGGRAETKQVINGHQEGRRGGSEADSAAVLEPRAATSAAAERVRGGGAAVGRAARALRGLRGRAAAAVRGAPRAAGPARVPVPAPPRRGGVRVRRRGGGRHPRAPVRGGRLPLAHLLRRPRRPVMNRRLPAFDAATR